MLTLILGRDRAETGEPPPDDAAFFRGIAIGVALSVAFYVALGLLWWLA